MSTLAYTTEREHALEAGEPGAPALKLVEEVCHDLAERHCASHDDPLRRPRGVQVFVLQTLRAMGEAEVHHVAKVLCELVGVSSPLNARRKKHLTFGDDDGGFDDRFLNLPYMGGGVRHVRKVRRIADEHRPVPVDDWHPP